MARLSANHADVARAIAKLARDGLHSSQTNLTVVQLDAVAGAVRDAAYTWLDAQVDALRSSDSHTKAAASDFVKLQRGSAVDLGVPRKMPQYADFVKRYKAATPTGRKRIVAKEANKDVKFVSDPKLDQAAIPRIILLLEAVVERVGTPAALRRAVAKIFPPLKNLPVAPLDSDFIVQVNLSSAENDRFIDLRLNERGLWLRVDATGSEDGEPYALPLLGYSMTSTDSGFSSNELDTGVDAVPFLERTIRLIADPKARIGVQLLGASFDPPTKGKPPKRGSKARKKRV